MPSRLAPRAQACVATLLLCACSGLRNERLTEVAKDWSYVIRASQVMPVYPLTEDLFPGDVFLVQTPIDKQHAQWKEKGYLPLDNHVGRVSPKGYTAFYDESFNDLEPPEAIPSAWLRAPNIGPTVPPSAQHPWDHAPRASFPTYSFAVESGYGFSGALPISGIPIGVSLLGSSSAYGSVTLADARTYGVEIESLYRDVETWADEQRGFLVNFAPSEGRVNYLRVINRIYLVGRVDVSIQTTDSQAVGIDAGAPRPVELIVPTRASLDDPANPAPVDLPGEGARGDEGAEDPPTQRDGGVGDRALERYKQNLESLNSTLERDSAPGAQESDALKAAGAPGGSLKITAASARSVSMAETFPRPLVIGYLGFDVAIGPGGSLGAPVPTFAVLDVGLTPSIALGSHLDLVSGERMSVVHEILVGMKRDNRPGAASLLERLEIMGALVPARYPCDLLWTGVPEDDGKTTVFQVHRRRGDAARTSPATFAALVQYRSDLASSIENLEAARAALEDPDHRIKLDDEPVTTDARVWIHYHLSENLAAREALEEALKPYARVLYEADVYTAPYQPTQQE